MGKALMTAILIVAYPEKYGVWNNTSEAGLKSLKVWPQIKRGASFGERYKLVNQVLGQLASGLGVDLWTLHGLFFRVPSPDDKPVDRPVTPIEPWGGEGPQQFGLERHLHDFLRDNWNRTSLAKEWILYSEQGEPEAGYEYPTDIGRIDLLAKHRTKPGWLVVEVKRGQTNDDTVGQVLRYIGWVRRNLAESGEPVGGIIICREADDALRYAVGEIPGVSVQLYEVSFSLRPAPPIASRFDAPPQEREVRVSVQNGRLPHKRDLGGASSAFSSAHSA